MPLVSSVEHVDGRGCDRSRRAAWPAAARAWNVSSMQIGALTAERAGRQRQDLRAGPDAEAVVAADDRGAAGQRPARGGRTPCRRRGRACRTRRRPRAANGCSSAGRAAYSRSGWRRRPWRGRPEPRPAGSARRRPRRRSSSSFRSSMSVGERLRAHAFTALIGGRRPRGAARLDGWTSPAFNLARACADAPGVVTRPAQPCADGPLARAGRPRRGRTRARGAAARERREVAHRARRRPSASCSPRAAFWVAAGTPVARRGSGSWLTLLLRRCGARRVRRRRGHTRPVVLARRADAAAAARRRPCRWSSRRALRRACMPDVVARPHDAVRGCC